MDDQKQKVIDSLKQANNILITVRNSPSIDQLAACIALTLVVNELGKHGTAVFSGHVPSTLEFLEPNKTLEPNTDSLRDFIISLDKAKADKLRYKVEDSVVRVFITPYRTSLSSNDLEFSQGDFNVDVVVALGVHNQNDLDEAITSHGRILHDATVISMNTEGGGAEDLGSINWIDPNVSSLSEMVFSFADQLGKEDVVDNQVATALLTGIVAETGRFGNAKTKPQTMEVAAKLLSAGANQELVATKLAEPERPEEPPHDSSPDGQGDTTQPTDVPNDKGGELDIEHLATETSEAFQLPQPSQPQPADGTDFAQENAPFPVSQSQPTTLDQEDRPSGAPAPDSNTDVPPIIDLNQPEQSEGDEQEALDFLRERKVDDNVHARLEPLHSQSEVLEAPKIIPDHPRDEAQVPGTSDDEALNTRFAMSPPTMGGTLTANLPNDNSTGVEALLGDQKSNGPMLSHDSHNATPSPPQPTLDAAPLPTEPGAVKPTEKTGAGPQFTTLEDLEKQVRAHVAEPSVTSQPDVNNHPVLQAVPQPTDPQGAQNMPAPSSIKLPSPLEVSPSGSPMASPLAPPPPVPPPLPSA